MTDDTVSHSKNEETVCRSHTRCGAWSSDQTLGGQYGVFKSPRPAMDGEYKDPAIVGICDTCQSIFATFSKHFRQLTENPGADTFSRDIKQLW